MLDSHAPTKRSRVRGDQLPWITPEIKLHISRRCQLYRAFRKNPSAENWDAFKRQRNKVTSLKSKALRCYFVSAKSNKSSPREFWRKLKPLLPNTRRSYLGKITLIENGQVHNKPQEVAEIFNNYFAESGLSHSLALPESELDKHPSVNLINEIADDQDQEFSFSFQPVTAKYVLDLLLNLNGSKATGLDGIPPRLLKAYAPALATPLTRLINYCLEQSCWISEWKSSNICPVFKKGCEATKVSYRPI